MEIPFSLRNKLNQEITATLTLKPSHKTLAVIVHGLGGTQNSIFFASLAESLGISCLRFDFPLLNAQGQFRYADLDLDLDDLCQTVTFVENKYSLECKIIIGHSRGSTVAFLYAATVSAYKQLLIVNLAGRAVLKGALDKHESEDVSGALSSDIKFEWNISCRGGDYAVRIGKDLILKLLSFQKTIDSLKDRKNVRIVSIHGEKDRIVPVRDSEYVTCLNKNNQLITVPKTDHFFRNVHCEVMEMILNEINLYMSCESDKLN